MSKEEDMNRQPMLEAHAPKWTYAVRMFWHQHADGTFTLRLTYKNGTPLSKEDAREFMLKQGFLKE